MPVIEQNRTPGVSAELNLPPISLPPNLALELSRRPSVLTCRPGANLKYLHTGGYRMKFKTVLTVSAIYLGILGIGFMFVPQKIGIDAVPADASPALIAYLRIFGGPFLGLQF